MKKVGILYHPMIEATQAKAREIQDILASRGVSCWLGSAWDTEAARSRLNGTELILTTGGDGTILRAAQAALGGIPITGINLGTLGFMTELSVNDLEEKLGLLLEGRGWIDERAMLQTEVIAAGGEPRTFHALNDVVAARGEIPRVIRAEITLDGEHFTTYRADGVIVATATGSTGYALAAGGPMLYPQSRDFLLMPIVPHLNAAHALVLPCSARLEVRVATVHRAIVSIDGHTNLPLSGGDMIRVSLSPSTTRFLRLQPEKTFYASLQQKLRGK